MWACFSCICNNHVLPVYNSAKITKFEEFLQSYDRKRTATFFMEHSVDAALSMYRAPCVSVCTLDALVSPGGVESRGPGPVIHVSDGGPAVRLPQRKRETLRGHVPYVH